MTTQTDIRICPDCGNDRAQLASDLKDPDVYEVAPGGSRLGMLRLRSEKHQAALDRMWQCPSCLKALRTGSGK